MPAPRTNFRDLTYLTLDDFSPGIWSASGVSLASASSPAPKGAAQPGNTYRCYALPNRALAPLPGKLVSFALPSPDGAAIATAKYYVVGLHQFGPLNALIPYADEIHVGVEWVANAGPNTNKFAWYRVRMFEYPATNPPTIDTVTTVTGPINSGAGGGTGMTWANTRMHPTDPTLPGIPVVVATWNKSDASSAFVWVFPPPAAPNTTAVFTLSTLLGTILAHQGRVVLLTSVPYSHGAVGISQAGGEIIDFTDPANSITMGAQNQVFVQEAPTGIGAFGSISAGELIMIKNKGGAYLIMGDIANPTIIRLPGVTSAIGQRAAQTTIGLVYMAHRNGIWVWEGGNTSKKISQQLDDDTFATVPMLVNVVCDICSWGDLIILSNGYCYDTTGSAWWILDNSVDIRWAVTSLYGSILYTSPSSYANAGLGLTLYDRTVPATDYSWQSHPLTLSTDRLVDVREIVVIAQGVGNVVVSVTDVDGTVRAGAAAVVASLNKPKMIRVGMDARCDMPEVRIVSTGTGGNPAPIVYSVAIGYREQETVNALV